jgi:AcrR family transcriptional regulator
MYGWPQVTLERIAEQAGISRVTLHRRGITRTQLLGRLAERAAAEYRDAMWPMLTGEGTGEERLRRTLNAICNLAEQNLSLLIALDTEANAAVFHDTGDQEALTRDAFTEPIERVLRDGFADGTLRETDPRETATVLFNQVGWTYIHLRTGHRWSPERGREAIVELAMNGVSLSAESPAT